MITITNNSTTLVIEYGTPYNRKYVYNKSNIGLHYKGGDFVDIVSLIGSSRFVPKTLRIKWSDVISPLTASALDLFWLLQEYIKTKDIDIDIENVLLKILMVDKWNNDHTYRLVQTTSTIYKAYATNYMLLISYLLYSDKIDKSKFDKYINDLIKVHEINLEYEKEFPCVIYVKKSNKRVSNKKDKIVKEKVIKERVPKESKAEAKLRRQALLFSNVTINIKKK